MIVKCIQCELFYKNTQMKQHHCQKHFICKTCVVKPEKPACKACQDENHDLAHSQRLLFNYPIQGVMINFDKNYNPEGESEFSSRRNCHQRTLGWTMCFLLGIVFFFSGLSLAIKTSQKGLGAIITVLGIIGVAVSTYFALKIRRVDQYFESNQNMIGNAGIHPKPRLRRTISSVDDGER